MTPTQLKKTLTTASLLAAAVMMTPAQAQVQVQNGSALDANQQVGSGGYNQAAQRVDYRARNLLITGNVGGGRAFQGSVGYSADGAFQGSLGSDSLFDFRRNSVFSAPNAGGLNYRASQVGDRVVVTRPSDNITGLRVGTGNGLTTRTAYDPGSGVVTFRQSGGGLVAISGFTDTQSLRNAGTSLGLVQTPRGLVSVDASPLTGIRYNPLQVNDASQPQQDRPSTLTDPEELDQDSGTDPTTEPLSQRVDGQYRPGDADDAFAQRTLREDPLSITLGTQVQSQMALSLAGQDAGDSANTQTMSLRERVFGKEQAADEAPKAPENPYEKLIADILASAKGETVEPDDNADTPEGDDDRPRWQQIFDEPEQAVLDAKLEARDMAIRLSLGMVDDEGNIDYDTELPSIEADSELGKLLADLSYELPRVQTLAGEDPNRINKLLARGEQELQGERYIIAENIYRQVLREKSDDPLAQAGLVHSQMGAGMIRSAAYNLRDLFAEHPELIALKYDADLMPKTERLRWLQGRLQKQISEEADGSAPGLVLAYLGYQLDAKPLTEFGLAVAEAEAPRDPLMPVLRKIWIEGKDAESEEDEAAPAEKAVK